MPATQPQPSTPFELRIEPARETVLVCPAGELELASAPRVRDEVEKLAAAGFPRIVLDLRETTFLDTTALHLILELDAAARNGAWEFAVIDGSPELDNVFDITGMRPHIPFLDPIRLRERKWR